MIAPFMPKPFCTFRGHTADVLDVSWSKVSWGRRGRDRMVVGFTTTYAISAYHH